MSSLLREVLVLLFRNRPDLAPAAEESVQQD
jgi:hypothetical protein